MKEKKHVPPGGFGNRNEIHPPSPIEKKPKSIVSKIGSTAFVVIFIGTEFMILTSQLQPIPKITLTALFIFVVCALYATAVERKKQNEEFEKTSKSFEERLERIRKKRES